MFKFEVGSVYYARSACNHDCVFLMKVLSRTEKSVKAEFSGEGVKRAMIRVSDSGEWVMPWHYSMAPVFRAERLYSDRAEQKRQTAPCIIGLFASGVYRVCVVRHRHRKKHTERRK